MGVPPVLLLRRNRCDIERRWRFQPQCFQKAKHDIDESRNTR